MTAAKWLVCVLAAAVCAVRSEDRVKMCGRELIRLAVSACGNSRLRRSLRDTEVDQHQHTSGWGHSASNEKDRASDSLHIPPQLGGRKDVSSMAAHWYFAASRIRRAAGKISDICCEKGCSMKELIQFC